MHLALAVAAAAAVIAKVGTDLADDARIRDETYTKPLSNMPANAAALMKEMMEEAAKDSSLTAEQLEKINREIYQMMSEGAVAQRNFQMKKTREAISGVGLYLSWFMKQEGMSYQAIQAKYERDFAEDERRGHMKMIESAARSNSALLSKFYASIVKKFWGASSGPSLPIAAKL